MGTDAPQRLLDREDELDAIDAAIERARGATGAVVVIDGPPGIGSSALLAHAVRHAQDEGLDVAAAAGGELEADHAFGVARQLAPDVAGGDELFAALAAHHEALARRAARRPLLVVVDDAHWADDPSQRLLDYLVRRIDGLAVALVVAVRRIDPLSAPALAALAAQPQAVRLRPAPLSRVSVTTLTHERLGDAADDAIGIAVADATAGNPFLVHAALDALAATDARPRAEQVAELGPPAVALGVARRMAALPEPARRLARAVAVLGRDEQRRAAARLAEIDDEAQLRACADALVGADVLAPGPALEFVAPIVAVAVHDALPEGDRVTAHERAARILDDEGAPAQDVAAHLLAVAPRGDEWVVDRLAAAADDAAARGAPAAGVAALRRAMREPPPPARVAALLLKLARLETLAGDPDAIAHLEHAIDMQDDAHARVAAGIDLGRLRFFSGDIPSALAALQRAAAEVPPDARELRVWLAAELMAVDRITVAMPPLRPGLEFAPGELPGDTAGERALLASLALSLIMRAEPVAEAVALARRVLEAPGAIDDGPASPTCLNAVSVLLLADELELGEDWLARALRRCADTGDAAGRAAALTFRSVAHQRRGAIGDALADAQDAMRIAQEHGQRVLASFASGFVLEAQLESGDLDAADAAMRASGMDGELPDSFHLNSVLLRRGRLRSAQGRAQEARDDLTEVGVRFDRAGMLNPTMGAWRTELGAVLVTLGDEQAALALARAELELARRVGLTRSEGMAMRVAALAGPVHEREHALRAAGAVLAAAPDRLQAALALLDLGAHMRRQGQRVQAREPLRRALDMATRLGAGRAAARARDELLASGARPRADVLGGVAALTPSERRVATLAATGRTNAAIAAELFVGVRTVEMHLTSAYRKLGIGGRADLDSALGG